MGRKVEWLPIPEYPEYDVSTRGDVEGPHGRVEVESVIGSKAYILYRDGAQFLVRPSELIQGAFPHIPDEEAMSWDRIPRSAGMVRKEMMEVETYYTKRIRQLYAELDRIMLGENQ